MENRNTSAKSIALGGVFAALALCILCLGTLIPVNTYVGPMLCALLLQMVLSMFGNKIAWAWFFAVALLALLLCPDREAAGVFLVLGYYPILKRWIDRRKLALLWKGLYFNVSILALYWALIFVLGLPGLDEEFQEFSKLLLIVLLVLGNLTFYLLDKVLGKPFFQRFKPYGIRK